MAYLKELDEILNQSTALILQNQNICKLVNYYPDKVNFRYDPLSQPDIENPNSLLLNRIYPMPKIPDAETEQICFIDINVAGGNLLQKNKGFIKVNLIFDIICHLDSWIIKNGCRPLKILSEIDQIFNNQLLSVLPIENKPNATPFVPKNYAHKFYGYSIAYELMVNSNIEC